MILGLLSFFVIPLLGPVAIMVANGALRDDRFDGAAKAGLILGWISTAVLLFGFCLVGAALTGAVSLWGR